MKTQKLIFKQLFDKESSTYTYLLADPQTKEAVLIDPVKENINRDLKLLKELDLKLKYIMDTHVHADHITASNELRDKTDAQTVLNVDANVTCNNIGLNDYEKLFLGEFEITGIKTPGHTDGCMSYLVEDKIFTGDSLLIRGTGRTDFQQGNSKEMFNSIQKKIFNLPDETMVYPGHDYNGHTVSTVGEEKNYNPRIKSGITEEEYVQTMKDLKLAEPKHIHTAVPANLNCGKTQKS
ncbi:MAG: MBL fold metallo-hydrolase [Bacteriovoracaceae bacterium]|jgi:sulfur dioxygenase|nr:MBL fold metallo-hydrolase [Bacteriovoracaceae bacterium]